MTTLAEKLFQKGEKEGEKKALLEMIEIGLKMKFGTDGIRLFPTSSKSTTRKFWAWI